jgi:arginyl-tRNA synthetase
MKRLLAELIDSALNKMGINATSKILIDYAKERTHGDFTCNIAMLIAKTSGRKPRELAQDIVSHIPAHAFLKQVQMAGSGFINFFVHPEAFRTLIHKIFQEKSHYGHSRAGEGRRIHIEFVSSNPTGPLHVGHGRGAAYGSAVSDLLSAIGCTVHREYYLNDAGRQVDTLTLSLWLRYLEICCEPLAFPDNCYQGKYITDIAQKIFDAKQKTYCHPAHVVYENISPPADDKEKEKQIDQLVVNAKKLLGEKFWREISDYGLPVIVKDMKEDLKEFGVTYQSWFSEREMWDRGLVERAVALLRDKGYLYEKEGAVWFQSTAFGDDKDRVVIRENGQYTYFASDIAYHKWKFEHYSEVIDVLGADHHGYVPRLKAIITALGYSAEKFHAPIVQFAALFRGKERIAMSTRGGSFVTLRELREEVGKDAARFFYLMRKADQHIDFDLELAKSQSNENPVYYIQYAYARICSVFRQMTEKKMHWEPEAGLNALEKLDSEPEKNLFLMLSRFTETLSQAALQYEPHLIAYYLRELCDHFHSYYNAFPFLVTDDTLRHARLCLIAATKQIIANGLHLLGVSAPEMM